MKSASDVDALVSEWISKGLSKSQIIINTAEAALGWSYVWGAVGALCTPEKRQYYANRDVCPEGERKVIIAKCQALNGSGKYCGGCQFYPNNMRTLCNDCQGFAKQVFKRVGITLSGGGCTTMWGNGSQFSAKGTIELKSGEKMLHVGIHIGNGNIIECSGTVKRNSTSNKKWTHYAIPKGMDGTMPVEPTLRKGSTGEYVTLLQTKLIQRGYDLSPYGADGKFGNKTYQAVMAFQRDNGLQADGVCGARTWEALNSGQTSLYTVTIQHVSKSVADDIVGKFGGIVKKE